MYINKMKIMIKLCIILGVPVLKMEVYIIIFEFMLIHLLYLFCSFYIVC